MNTLRSESQQRERIPTEIHDSSESASRELAAYIAGRIRQRAAEGRSFVLGLATGSTPVRLYRELVRLHREEGLSFSNVITFNLDEYHGLGRTHPESYWRFMHEQLFNHIDVPADQVNIPDGLVARGDVFAWCRAYEERIAAAGGIDLQVLGIGRTGHIGFNEPGSGRDSRTRIVTLDALTRRDAARDFLGESNVPRYAITMGVGTILDARELVMLAWGEAKAEVTALAVEGPVSDSLPASFLQLHAKVRVLVDRAAASGLTRLRTPWLVGPVEWTPALARRSVTWLSQVTGRPLLKLLDSHYGEHGMAELLTEQGPAYHLNIRIFNETQHTITGWPGGKPNADDTHRPERALPHPKRVLVLAPEPSDEMLGMGGTIARLASQGHQVSVVYMSSGNLAVPDTEAAAAAELLMSFSEKDGPAQYARTRAVWQKLMAQDGEEGAAPAAANEQELRRLKGLIRRGEARSALRTLGLPTEAATFLGLPFYEKGRYRQFRPGLEDFEMLRALLVRHQPHQVFVTGADQDPSSLGALCFDLFRKVLADLKGEAWLEQCRVWLYRTPDKRWAPHEIDMAVPLSPDQLAQKVQAIYQHRSQRSQSPSRGELHSEEWLQAEQAARELAKAYDALGLAEYEAIEAFSRWKG